MPDALTPPLPRSVQVEVTGACNLACAMCLVSSIRGGADFARVCRNVAGLVAVRRELDAESPSLSLVFVAMRRNVHELPDLVRLARRLGVDRLFVQNLSHSFADTDPAGSYADIRRFAETEALWSGADVGLAEARFAEAERVAGELGVDLRLPRVEEQDAAAALARGCDWPFTSTYVTHRGQVQPCCMFMGADRAVLGSLEEEGFAEIWHGEEYRRFRAGLVHGPPPEVCSGCSLYRGVF